MTRFEPFKLIVTMLVISLFSITAYAYEKDKDKELCRHPKVQEFNLPEYGEPDKKEVPPEADFSFVISGWSDPKKIKIEAKGVKIPYTVESSETFHRVKGKLPAEFTGKYVRLSVRIPAVLGCYTTQGWLLKVADKPAAAEAPGPAPSPTVAPAEAKPAGPSAEAGANAPKPEPQAPVAPSAPSKQTEPAPQAAPASSPSEATPETGTSTAPSVE